MFGKKIKLDKETMRKALGLVEVYGYTSIEEMIGHLVEKEFTNIEQGEDFDEIKKKLQGLGYM
jgi:hypothetical protein